MTPSASRARLLVAFLLAPLAAPIAYAVALLVITVAGPRSTPSLGALGELVLAVFALGTPLAYAAALLAGAPVYLLLRRLALVRRGPVWVAGAAIGAIVALAMVPYLGGELFSIRFPWWAGASLGLISAEAFLQLLAWAGRGTAAGRTSDL